MGYFLYIERHLPRRAVGRSFYRRPNWRWQQKQMQTIRRSDRAIASTEVLPSPFQFQRVVIGIIRVPLYFGLALLLVCVFECAQ